MSAKTSIEWTDRTWNPVRGCSMAKGSETGGCLNCYAARMASRGFKWAKGLARMTSSGPRWTGVVRLVPEILDEPLHWRKPQKVFVNSMSDLFHESLQDEAIDQVFAVMAATFQRTRHTFQILTKRPARMRAYMATPDRLERIYCAWRSTVDWGGVEAEAWPLPNVWLGVSVEDQATADERIPLLLQTPAAVRFVSYEPALGPVDFSRFFQRGECPTCGPVQRVDEDGCCLTCGQDAMHYGIDWLIVGGESGPGARPCDAQWARSPVAQCKAAGVAVFVKQMGRWVLGDDAGFDVNHWLLPHGRAFVPPIIGPNAFKRPADAIGFSLCDPKGGDMAEWPEDIRVREFPAA